GRLALRRCRSLPSRSRSRQIGEPLLRGAARLDRPRRSPRFFAVIRHQPWVQSLSLRGRERFLHDTCGLALLSSYSTGTPTRSHRSPPFAWATLTAASAAEIRSSGTYPTAWTCAQPTLAESRTGTAWSSSIVE